MGERRGLEMEDAYAAGAGTSERMRFFQRILFSFVDKGKKIPRHWGERFFFSPTAGMDFQTHSNGARFVSRGILTVNTLPVP